MSNLRTNRGLLKWIILTLITFGLYDLIMMHNISEEINLVAAKDGKKTMNYLLLFFIIAPITLGLALFVWMHRISARIGEELKRRNIEYSFGAGSFWGWNILGALIFIGPFVYKHKLLTAMNYLNESYNAEKK